MSSYGGGYGSRGGGGGGYSNGYDRNGGSGGGYSNGYSNGYVRLCFSRCSLEGDRPHLVQPAPFLISLADLIS